MMTNNVVSPWQFCKTAIGLLLILGSMLNQSRAAAGDSTILSSQLYWEESIKPGELEPGDKGCLVIALPQNPGASINVEQCDIAEKLQATPQKSRKNIAVGDIVILKRVPNVNTQSLQLFFTAYKPGPAKIPPIAIECNGKSIGETKELSFTVLPLEQAQPNYFSFEFGGISKRALLQLGLVLIVLVLAGTYLGVFLWRRLSSAKATKKISTPSPLEDFLKTLNSMSIEKVLEEKKYKQAYFKLSEALKKYLAFKTGLPCEEMTSHEILAALVNEHSQKAKELENLRQIFDRLDLVKFTDYIPNLAEMKELFSQMKEWANRWDL